MRTKREQVLGWADVRFWREAPARADVGVGRRQIVAGSRRRYNRIQRNRSLVRVWCPVGLLLMSPSLGGGNGGARARGSSRRRNFSNHPCRPVFYVVKRWGSSRVSQASLSLQEPATPSPLRWLFSICATRKRGGAYAHGRTEKVAPVKGSTPG